MTDPQATCGCKWLGDNHIIDCGKHKSDLAAKAREIAEHVADIIWELPGGVDIREKGVRLIAAALFAARQAGREEVVDRFGHVPADIVIQAKEEGYRRGLEEAAKVAEEQPITDFGERIDQTDLKDKIATRIRQLRRQKDWRDKVKDAMDKGGQTL